MEQNQTTRPSKIGTAVTLLYIGAGVGILNAILYPSLLIKGKPLTVYTIICLAIGFGIGLLLIFMIGKGRNWARITFLVLFILSQPATVSLTMRESAHLISLLLGIAHGIISIVALVFLFQRPSSEWFREMKANK